MPMGAGCALVTFLGRHPCVWLLLLFCWGRPSLDVWGREHGKVQRTKGNPPSAPISLAKVTLLGLLNSQTAQFTGVNQPG
jgi:hypothetical protein